MRAWVSLRGASSSLSNNDILRPCVWAGERKCPICVYFHPLGPYYLWWSPLHFYFLLLIFDWHSCHPQRVCSCLPNPSDSSLHSFMPCFIFISGSADCPHSEGTQLTSAPNNNYHPGYLSSKILAVDGEILHLSMCTAPSKTIWRNYS